MRTYALVQDGVVAEVIQAFVNEEGFEVPINERFSPDLVANMVDITGVPTQPDQRWTYNGTTFLAPVEVAPQFSKEEIEKFRLIAYSDPLNGCDRYFSESISLQAEGFAVSSTEVKEAKAKGLARKQEIQALYPYPV